MLPSFNKTCTVRNVCLASAAVGHIVPQGLVTLQGSRKAAIRSDFGGFFFFSVFTLESSATIRSGGIQICPKLRLKIVCTAPCVVTNTRALSFSGRYRIYPYDNAYLSSGGSAVFLQDFAAKIFDKKQSNNTFIDDYKQAEIDAGLPPSVDAEGLTTTVFVSATIMTVASMLMNITFAFLVVSNPFAKVLLAAAYFSSDIFKIAAPSLCRFFWLRGNPFFSVVIVIGLLLTTYLSWVSGTGFLSETTAETASKQLTNSAEYKNNQSEQHRLQADASALAVSPASLAKANRELERLQAEWERAYAKNSTYMTRDYTPKSVRNSSDTWHNATDKAIAEDMTPIDNAIAAQKRILQRGDDYQSKVSELKRLQDLTPTTDSGMATLPVFKSLAAWFDEAPSDVRVQVFVTTSMILEVVSGIGWLAWGMMAKPRPFSPAELARANYEQRAHMNIMNKAINEYHQEIDNETVRADSISAQSTAKREDMESAPTHQQSTEYYSDEPTANGTTETYEWPTNDRLEIGRHYACQTCSAPFMARTTWQKYCAHCTAEKKAKFRDDIGVKSSGKEAETC